MFGKLLSLVIICLLVWAGFERIRRKLGFEETETCTPALCYAGPHQAIKDGSRYRAGDWPVYPLISDRFSLGWFSAKTFRDPTAYVLCWIMYCSLPPLDYSLDKE